MKKVDVYCTVGEIMASVNFGGRKLRHGDTTYLNNPCPNCPIYENPDQVGQAWKLAEEVIGREVSIDTQVLLEQLIINQAQALGGDFKLIVAMCHPPYIE